MIKCAFENGKNTSLRHAVVDALVIRSNEILLIKREKSLIEGGKWALAGGYVERDETIEQSLLREVYEETGWVVNNIKLLKIIDNPKRPGEDRQNIAFVYICQAVKKTGQADWESDEQKWFKLSELPQKSKMSFDHLEIIKDYFKI